MFNELLHKDCITIFNRKPEGESCKWHATAITKAHVITDKSFSQSTLGEQPSTTMTISVLMDNGYISGKEWMPQIQWMKQEDVSNCITAKGGEYFDMVILGAWEGPDIVDDSEYKRGFYSWMKQNRDYVYAVISVSGPYKYLPHINITAR